MRIHERAQQQKALEDLAQLLHTLNAVSQQDERFMIFHRMR